jgi:sulfur-oxidizing protein SoxY
MKGRKMNRRDAIKTGGGSTVMALMVAAGLVKPEDVFAQATDWNKAAFETKNLNDTVKAFGGMTATESKDITFVNAPDIAENGAVVPVGVSSKIPKTEMIAILVEKNPNSLSAAFMIPDGTEPTVSTRVKMGQTSNVHAVVKADGKFFYATKEIKVTLGGCGG